MGFQKVTPDAAEDAFVDQWTARLTEQIVDNLVYVGEKALAIARSGHSVAGGKKYQDQTGNLTSSIGYCVLVDGRTIVKSNFEVVKDGQEGASRGKEFLEQLMDENRRGIVFIMVAGMNYAKYVEAMSLDVLESAEMMAQEMIPKLLKTLQL